MGYYVPPKPYEHPFHYGVAISNQTWSITSVAALRTLTIPVDAKYMIVASTTSAGSSSAQSLAFVAFDRTATASVASKVYDYTVETASSNTACAARVMIDLHNRPRSVTVYHTFGGLQTTTKTLTVTYYQ